jgi:hypothetical protein
VCIVVTCKGFTAYEGYYCFKCHIAVLNRGEVIDVGSLTEYRTIFEFRKKNGFLFKKACLVIYD